MGSSPAKRAKLTQARRKPQMVTNFRHAFKKTSSQGVGKRGKTPWAAQRSPNPIFCGMTSCSNPLSCVSPGPLKPPSKVEYHSEEAKGA